MTKKDNSNLNRLMTVVQWLTDHNTLVTTVSAVATKKTEIQAEITALQAARITQDQGMAGTSETKKQNRNTLINGMLKVASGLYAYATANNLPAIKELAKISRPTLGNFNGQKLIDKAQNIYNTANPLAASLTSFNVAAADLTALNASIGTFTTQLPKPRERVGDLKQSRAIIEQQNKLSYQSLADLKGLMQAFRVTNPNEYASFISATQLVDPGTSTLDLIIKVIDAITNSPLPNALISIPSASFERETTALGNVQIASLPEGSHAVQISKVGYATQSVQVGITHGETHTLNVPLQPIPATSN